MRDDLFRVYLIGDFARAARGGSDALFKLSKKSRLPRASAICSVRFYKNARSCTKYGVSVTGGMLAVVFGRQADNAVGVTPALFVSSDGLRPHCVHRCVSERNRAERGS